MGFWQNLFFYLIFSGGIFISCWGLYYKKAYLATDVWGLFGPFKGFKSVFINLVLLALTVFGLRIVFFGNHFNWTFFISTLTFWVIIGLLFLKKKNF